MVIVGLLITLLGFAISLASLGVASGVGGRLIMTLLGIAISLFGILGKPPRSATIEEMDEGVRRVAANRYLRAVGGKRR